MKEWPNAPFKQTENSKQILGHLYTHGDLFVRSGNEFSFFDTGILSHVLGLRIARELFNELSDEYGVEHAGFMPVIGRTQSGRSGEYIVSHKIDGEVCVNPVNQTVPDTQIPEARVLLDKLSNYAITKHEAGDPMLVDIFKLEQYIYVPERDTMVLIDTDPYFESQHGGSFAYHDMQPLARQLLDQDSYQEWNTVMSRIAQESEQIAFDESF